MLEKIVGLDRMTIHQCEELAKRLDFDGSTFDLVGPNGRKKAKWLDAYMGMFQIDGESGFIMTKQIAFAKDLWCENLMPAEEQQ